VLHADRVVHMPSAFAKEGADIIAIDICQQINSVDYSMATLMTSKKL
jgi:hypothetical protein